MNRTPLPSNGTKGPISIHTVSHVTFRSPRRLSQAQPNYFLTVFVERFFIVEVVLLSPLLMVRLVGESNGIGNVYLLIARSTAKTR